MFLHYNSESLKDPIVCVVKDIVDTYKKIINHWPIYNNPEEARSHSIFLFAKIEVPRNDTVWFTKVSMGRNHLNTLVKKMNELVGSLRFKKITNNSA